MRNVTDIIESIERLADTKRKHEILDIRMEDASKLSEAIRDMDETISVLNKKLRHEKSVGQAIYAQAMLDMEDKRDRI